MGGGGGTGNFTFGDEQDVQFPTGTIPSGLVGGANVAPDGSTATAVQSTANADEAVIIIAIPNNNP